MKIELTKILKLPPSRVILMSMSNQLTDTEITEAFKGNENAQWYKALTQRIMAYREVSASNAASACGQNNPLATAAATGAHEVLGQLLADLDGRVKSE